MATLRRVLECSFKWSKPRMQKEESYLRAQAVLGQSWGDEDCSSNKQLGRLADALKHRYPHIKLLLQWEIADTLPPTTSIFARITPDVLGQYIRTYRVFKKFREICDKEGINEVVILAHPIQYWRVCWIAEKLGFEVVTVSVSSVRCDIHSKQFWTTHPIVSYPYELTVRHIELVMGTI